MATNSLSFETTLAEAERHALEALAARQEALAAGLRLQSPGLAVAAEQERLASFRAAVSRCYGASTAADKLMPGLHEAAGGIIERIKQLQQASAVLTEFLAAVERGRAQPQYPVVN
jgi:hypothetical protein